MRLVCYLKRNLISTVCRLGGLCTHTYQLLAYKRICVEVPVVAETIVTYVLFMCTLENKTIHFNMNCRVKNIICGTHVTHNGRNKYISTGTPIKNKVTANGKILSNGQGINYLKLIDVIKNNAGFNNSGAGLWHLFHLS